MQMMFAERVKGILSCGKIWREKQIICLSFPYFKHKMMIFYYEVALFQGETQYHVLCPHVAHHTSSPILG